MSRVKAKFAELLGAGYVVRQEHSILAARSRFKSEIPQVLLTVPHDGDQMFADVSRRNPERDGVTKRDAGIAWIATDLAKKFPVALVASLVSRQFLDPSRPEKPNGDGKSVAYVPGAEEGIKLAYQAYHEKIDAFLEEMVMKYGRDQVVVLDLHGFTPRDDFERQFDLILGTGNRATVLPESTRDDDLAFELTKRDYKVFLPDDPRHTATTGPYSGGYTIRRISRRELQVDAIQIEVRVDFRDTRVNPEATAKGEKLATDLAECLRKIMD